MDTSEKEHPGLRTFAFCLKSYERQYRSESIAYKKIGVCKASFAFK